jgi:acetyl-CoA synthetase (ADP-forming)
MIDDLRSQRLLGPCRGEPPVDRDALAEILVALSRAGEHDERLVSADLNPLIVRGGEPIPVDALVEMSGAAPAGGKDAHH